MRRLVLLGLGLVMLAAVGIDAHGQKKEDLPRYIKDLTAKEPKDRVAACAGIGAIGELRKVYAKDAVDPLCDVLRKDADATVRRAAAAALGQISADAVKATPALIQGLKDADNNVKVASATSLAVIGPGAKEAAPTLKELNDAAKAEAAKAREEQTKAKTDGDKAKEKAARDKGQAAGNLLRATGEALKNIGGGQ